MSAADDALRDLVDALLWHNDLGAEVVERDGRFGVVLVVDGWHLDRADAVNVMGYLDDVRARLRAERDRVEQLDRDREQGPVTPAVVIGPPIVGPLDCITDNLQHHRD